MVAQGGWLDCFTCTKSASAARKNNVHTSSSVSCLPQLLSQQEAYDRLLQETTAIERQNLEVLNQLLAVEREEREHGSEQLRRTATGFCDPSVLGQLVRVPWRGSGGVTPEDGSVTSREEHHPRGSSPAVGGVSGRRQEVMRQVDQVWGGGGMRGGK